MLSDDFANLMNQSIFIQPLTGNGLYGSVHGEGQTYVCHIVRTAVNITDKDGKDTVSSCQIYLDGDNTISYGDKLTIGASNPPILKIERYYDENGSDYSVVVFT